MRKKLPKILIIFFITIFILQMAALVFLLLNPSEVSAQVQFEPQVGVGEFQKGGSYTVSEDGSSKSNLIGKYIKAIYQYGTGVVGILAAVVLMIGGLLWLTAGGSQERVKSAQDWIKAALTGLVIALCSYIILLTINPDLVKFRPITVEPVKTNSDFSQYANEEGYRRLWAVIQDTGALLETMKQNPDRYQKASVNNSSFDNVFVDAQDNEKIYEFYTADGELDVRIWVKK